MNTSIIADRFWAAFVHRQYGLIACLIIGASASGLSAGEPVPAKGAPAGLELFRKQIRPLLESKCLSCHGSDKKKGGLDLSRRELALAGGKNGTAIRPGDIDHSLLLDKLSAGEMPPQNGLAGEQVVLVRQWIAAGAPYEGEPLRPSGGRAGADFWSLQPVRRPALPRVQHPGWIRTPIDAFILAKLEEKGLTPAPEADRRTLVRRLYFDLIGLPPRPEDIDAFEQDRSPGAYERLVDRLLDSPQYGERWARHWLDIVRFAESHGYETNMLRTNAWPYRDYVIQALNQDKPYPQFILEQLAGDGLKSGDWLVPAATGFLVGGAHDIVGNATEEGRRQQRMDDLDDMITATATTFLGLTLNCARCHDHKFDPLSQRDYYGLQALLSGVQHQERELAIPGAAERQRRAEEIRAELAKIDAQIDALEVLAQPNAKLPVREPVSARRNVERLNAMEVRFLRFTILATTDGTEPCIDELEVFAADGSGRNVALASLGVKATASSVYPDSALHRLEHVNDGQYGNSRSWISNERGKGWVQLEWPRPVRIDRVVWARDRLEQFRDRLPADYRLEVATIPGQWQTVASSQDRLPYNSQTKLSNPLTTEPARKRAELVRRREELNQLLPDLQPTLKAYVGGFTAPEPTYLLTRGDPMRRGEMVPPAVPEVVQPRVAISAGATDLERRQALARWLGDPRNPLPSRVMVNRVWQYHFGQGIVATPSDFGFNGDRPSHPELLDWLAAEFMQNAWQLKPLHRLIVGSATYRQVSTSSAASRAIDAQNRLLAHMNPRRTEAEALRDAILAVSGKLDRRQGGPGYNLWEKNTNYVAIYQPKESLGPAEFRRMIYQFKPRTQQDPTFGIFDCPDAALAKPKRTVSTTALQALNLLNSKFMLTQADAFAARLRSVCGSDPSRAVTLGFRIALGRPPTPEEHEAALALVEQHGLPALCRALYNANEFLYVD